MKTDHSVKKAEAVTTQADSLDIQPGLLSIPSCDLDNSNHVPVQSVLTGSVEAEFSSSQSSPRNAVPRIVQTAKGTLGPKVAEEMSDII